MVVRFVKDGSGEEDGTVNGRVQGFLHHFRPVRESSAEISFEGLGKPRRTLPQTSGQTNSDGFAGEVKFDVAFHDVHESRRVGLDCLERIRFMRTRIEAQRFGQLGQDPRGGGASIDGGNHLIRHGGIENILHGCP
jgi:hypothetical protein